MNWFHGLNSRELASVFWIFVLIIFTCSFGAGRKIIWDLLKIRIALKLLITIVLSGLYIALEARIGKGAGIWTSELLKDTLLWWLLSALPLIATVITANSTKGIYQSIIRKSISLSLFVTFYINLYTLSLPLEIILQPILFILISIDLISSQNAQLAKIRRFFSWVISSIGIILGIYVCDRIIQNWPPINLSMRAYNLILPAWLSLLYLPFLYLLNFYAVYDSVYLSIKITIKHNYESLKFFLWIFSKFRIQLNLIKDLSPFWIGEIYEKGTKEERNRIITSFKENPSPPKIDTGQDFESDL